MYTRQTEGRETVAHVMLVAFLQGEMEIDIQPSH